MLLILNLYILLYSFSVNTANLDLCSWNVVGVPMVNTMSMRFNFKLYVHCENRISFTLFTHRNLIGDCGIRLVAYEMPLAAVKTSNSKHPKTEMKYVFNLGVTPIDPSTYEDYEDSGPVISDDDGTDVVKILQSAEEEEDGVEALQDSGDEDEDVGGGASNLR
jgi:hypothetical protein